MVGLTRVVTTVQTVGFYSKIKDQPEQPLLDLTTAARASDTDFAKADATTSSTGRRSR
ncbi:MAG: hypothetical protein ACLU38_04710 [Dysosmobacter sp.]